MDILKEVLTKYWYLTASIIVLIGIIKFAIHASSRGLKAAISQLIAFVLIVTALVTLAGPFLNWTFANIVDSIRDSLIAQSGYELTSQTIDLIKNADVNDEPLSIDEEIIENARSTEQKSQSTVSAATPRPLQTPIVLPTATMLPEATIVPEAQVVPTRRGDGEPLVTVAPTRRGDGEPLVTVVPTRIQNFEPLVTVVPVNNFEPLVTVVPTAISNGGGPNLSYTVKRGDSLAKIAKQFGVSVNQLCFINNIRNCNVIYTNMVLVIP